MNEYFQFAKVPTTFPELIDAQAKFYKDMLDTQADMLKAFFDMFAPKKA